MLLVTLCAVLLCIISLSAAQLPPDFRLDEYPSYGVPRTPQFTFALIGYALAVDPVDGRRYIAGGVPAGVPQILPTASIYVASADKRSFSREVELLVPATYTNAFDFGTAVDIAGDFAAVSSPSSLNAATGVAGHVFVYRRTGGAWTQQAPALVIPNPDVDTCRFGRSLSLFGTQLLVGCPGNPASLNFTSAAFLFDLTTGALITAFETAVAPGVINYASAVALTATHVFVSQPFFNFTTSGLLHIFDLAAGTNATFLGDYSQFGRSLSAENGTVLVGAMGSAHLVAFNATAGAYQIEKSFAPVSVEDGNGDFGRDVALLANRALIGAPASNGKVRSSGSVQVYARDAATGAWGPSILVGATDGIPSGIYGIAVGLSRDQVFVGSVGGYCQTCAAFTPGVVYVYSQANSCGVPPIPDSPTVCSPQKQIFYFNPDLLISSPVVLTNPVVFIGNVSIGANVTAFINNSIPPITSFGCVNVTSGSLRIELTESVTTNIVIANSRCVSGAFETVELAPLPDDCRDYKIIGQDNDPATGSLILVLDIDSSGCSSDLAKKRGIIAGAVVGGVLLIAASVALFFYLGFKLRWRFLDSVFHKREDATTLHV